MKWYNILFGLVFLVFVVLRLFAASFPYHMDEYKWALIVDPVESQQGTIPHPPLGEVIMHYGGRLFGFDRLRFVPFFFAIADAVLVFMIVRRYWGWNAALFSCGLLAVYMWHVLASTMVDTDGAILPFFFLLASFAFFKYQEERSNAWLVFSAFSAASGTLIKLPFVIFFVSLGLWLWWIEKDIVKVVRKLGVYAALCFLWIVLLLGVVKVIYPYFEIMRLFGYASSFDVLNIFSRDYLHTFLLLAITLVMASPLLPGILLWCTFDKDKHARYFVIWLWLQLLFYVFVIDVSHRPIERYLMSAIYPVVILAAGKGSKWLKHGRNTMVCLAALVVVGGGGILLNSLNSETLPLYPKSGFVEELLQGNLFFNIPVTGGSGPMGFQLSAAAIVFMFAVPLLCLLAGLFSRSRTIMAVGVCGFLAGSVGYNIVLTEEFLFSRMSPAVPKLASEMTKYVVENPAVKSVVTFNDIGAYELKKSGKYAARFYAVPEYFDANMEKFRTYANSTFMILDFPRLNRESEYWKFLSGCQNIKEFNEKEVVGLVLDCRRQLSDYS